MPAIDYSVYYSRFHNDTDDHANMMASYMESIIKVRLPSDKNASILDIGCGYGFALRAARNLGYSNLRGVEMSTQQAERAKKSGFAVEVTDDTLDWLSKRSSSFDHILLLDVLEHLPTDKQIDLLHAIHCSLKPLGTLQLTTPNANAILSARWRYNDYTHYSSFTEHSLYFVLRNAGFTTIDIDNNKGIPRFPWRLWRRSSYPILRKWLVRWVWLQVFRSEVPWENIDAISFELNLSGFAQKS